MSYTLILFSCFIIYLFFGIYVYSLNKQSPTNQAFLILNLNLSFWALGYGLMNSANDIKTALFWLNVAAAGWSFFFSSFLYFALMLTNKKGIYQKGWFRIALYIPSVVFFINNLLYPVGQFKQTSFGLVFVYTLSSIRQIFYLYYISWSLLTITIIYLWGKKTDIFQEKKQARIIFLTISVTFILGSLFDILLPMFGLESVKTSIIFLLIASSGMWYAITKYKMMALTPEVAFGYVLKTMADPVLFIGNDFLIKDVNNAVFDYTGYSKEELIGQPPSLLLADDYHDFMELRQLIRQGNYKNLEKNIVAKNNDQLPCLFSSTVILGNWGESLGTVVVLHDITDRKKAEMVLRQAHSELELKVWERTAELEQMNEILQQEIEERNSAQKKIKYIAYHDTLTGLPNRLLLNDRLSQAILQAERNDKFLAVIFLDLDNFKLVNDSLGHHTGDVLLKQVANRLIMVVRKSDTIARISGDEFVFIINNLKESDDVAIVLNKIMGVFNEPFYLDDHENFVSASIGVAIYPTDGQDLDTLSRNADIAMYEAKAAGRNSYQLCTRDMKARFEDRIKLRNNLYRALERNELSVYYQPQIDILQAKITGFEALMRWKQNEEQFISPGDFIPIAEETGLIIPMGNWIIRTACKQIKLWRDTGFDNLRIAINLSENQLKQKNFVNQVAKVLEEVGLEPEVLEFEITERIVFRGNEELITALNELKKMGITISIDDFGVDYSSFMNIKKLPVDKLKIDMHFIQGISVNSKDEAIVDSIISLSHKVGLRVLAEGVETAEQLSFLRNRYCDEVQGFYYYKPMPINEVEEMLARKSNLRAL